MNVEHRTSNVQHRIKKRTSNTEHSTTPRRGFFSAVLILVTKILINSSVHMSVSSSFPIQRSMLDVRCSMFIFFQSLLGKNNLVLMLSSPLPLPTMDDNSLESPLPFLQTLTPSHSRLPPEPGIAVTGHPPTPSASGEDYAEDTQDGRSALEESLGSDELDCEVWRLVAGWRARIG